LKKVYAVGEGYGETAALPALINRVLRYLERPQWLANEPAARLPRGLLVDETIQGRKKPCKPSGIEKALALSRVFDALVIVTDADDEDATAFEKSVEEFLRQKGAQKKAFASMPVREFETWLVLSFDDDARRKNKIISPEKNRDGKALLEKLHPGYRETAHQVQLAKKVDVASLKSRSTSFARFVSEIERITK
jgi:Domain of unknown function (DUF4276)